LHDPREDTLTAYATLGGELFEDFFRKYEMKLSLEVGAKARNRVASQSVVRELEKFCKNSIQC
jgi:arsenite oxidase small subunit